LKLAPTSLFAEWRWRKEGDARSERHEEEYPFEWSMEPPPAVVKLIGEAGNKPIVPSTPKFHAKRIAATITDELRTASGDEFVTSYVFRDYAEELHKKLGTEATLYRRLMNHTLTTGAASYGTSEIKQATKEPASKKRIERAKEKKAENAKKAVPKSSKKTKKRSGGAKTT
jgi:hypothetical protein